MGKYRPVWVLVLLAAVVVALSGCEPEATPGNTNTVQRATVKVATDADGFTVEQKNIARRLTEDNKPGVIKHLYLISPFTGDVLLYCAVKGKVTSSGKRLTPREVASGNGQYVYDAHHGMSVHVNGQHKYTPEVLGDDGTYGSSAEYIYFWDVYGKYHQITPNGAIVLISDQPQRTKKAVLNLSQEK